MTYDISTGKWDTLAPYRAWGFAMTAINNQLVLVGGVEPDNNRIKVLGVWDSNKKQWTHPYPEYKTRRSSCSAFVYKEWLVVVGGMMFPSAFLSFIEVMNTNTKQWYAGPQTPRPLSCMKTAVVGDTCYFMGGGIYDDSTDKVYIMSLSALTSGLTSKEPSNSQIWSEVSGLQLTNSTPFSISGLLLAAGGSKKSTTAIHLLIPDSWRWVKVGDLPTPRRNCICEKITDKEMLMAGGDDGVNTLKSTYIALLK